MHQTLSPDVKGFIDEIKKIDDQHIQAKGWIFYHKTMEARPLKFVAGSQNFSINRHIRTDVGNHFHNNAIDDCGWEITFKYDPNLEYRIEIDAYGEWQPVFVLNFNNKLEEKPQIKEIIQNEVKSAEFKPAINRDQRSIPTLIVADNFYQDPDKVRDFALQLNFKEHPGAHKGKRTEECYRFEGLKQRFEELIGFPIKNWEKYGTNGCFQYCIGGDQIVYHKDLQQYAGVLYLTPQAPIEGGTALYRSKQTKQMKVDSDDHAKVFKNGYLDPSQFDLVDRIGNLYNRLILFDSQIIHSGLDYFGSDKDNGRLFQLFFFDLDLE